MARVLLAPRTLAILFALLLIFGFPVLLRFYIDWLWFGEVGYRPVFLRILAAKAELSAAVFAISFLAIALNLRMALGTLRRRDFEILTPDGPRSITVDPGRLRPLAFLLAAFAAFLLGSFAAAHWLEWLSFRSSTPFGTTDPVLGWDIGFFVFRLPLLQFLYQLALGILLLSTGGVVAIHLFAGNVGLDAVRGFFAHRSTVRHLSGLSAALLALLAFGAWLDVPALLTHPAGILYGASYVDVHARIPALRLLMAVAAFGAILAAAQPFLRGYRPLAAAFALYLTVWVGGRIYAAAIQRLVVAPNEQVRETPFIAHNIASTRAAFALDEVEERELEG
ncbi:MAG TPA: UPF0182 family protein, partial [Vicinamibacteria bacterium]